MVKRNVLLGDSHRVTPCNTQQPHDSCGQWPMAQSSLAHLDLCGSGAPPRTQGETDPLQAPKHCSDSSHNCTNATVMVREEMETHDQEEGRDAETRAFQQLAYFPQVRLQPAKLIIFICFLEVGES